MPALKSIAEEYVSTDLEEQADVQADITDLPFPDDRWDVIVCSHVLEHVNDDSSALKELRRVLAPGGRVVFIVPRRLGAATDEDPSVTDPKERTRRFGQADHVRIYGDDLEQRISAAGFDIMEPLSADHFTDAENERHRLRAINAGSDEAAYLCGYA